MAEVTVQETLDEYLKKTSTSKQAASTMKRAVTLLEEAGFPRSTPISVLNTEESIEKLQKWATTEKYDGPSSAAGHFASRVKTLINEGKPLKDANVLGEWERSNKGKSKDAPPSDKEFGIRFTRENRALELPDFDSFNVAIDRTARQIPDKEATAFFMIKMLTGLRNPDIVNLSLGKPVEGAAYGSFDPNIRKIYALSNKGQRINYDLGEVVHGILADLAADAQAGGRTKLFTKNETQLRNMINPVMRKNMEEMGLEIFNLKSGKADPFSVRDLRKNIFDIVEEEVGAGAANKVLGHSSGGDVGLKHYKVERTKRKTLSNLQKSQELFSSLYMESLGFDNPQMVFGAKGYGFSSDNFNTTLIAPTGVTTTQPEQQISNQTRTIEAQLSSTVDQTEATLNKRIAKLENLIDKTNTLQQQVDALASTTKKKTETSTIDSIEDLSDETKKSVGSGFDFGKFVGKTGKTIKEVALPIAVATGTTVKSMLPTPVEGALTAVVAPEDFDIAEQKGRDFVEQFTDSRLASELGAGAGVAAELITGGVADEGKSNLETASFLTNPLLGVASATIRAIRGDKETPPADDMYRGGFLSN